MEHYNPLVSVLVITYNSAKYIIETLESIKLQSFRNIELIVSDDCSADNTVDLANEWIAFNKNRFIKTTIITSNLNSGIPANCNRGLADAKGEYLKLIAGDDLLLTTCIEDNVVFAWKNKSVLTVSKMNELTEKGLKPRINDLEQKKLNRFINRNNQLKSYIRNPVFLNSPTFFIKMDMLKDIGSFDESFIFLEDQPMILKLLKKGCVIRFLDKYTVTYRTHGTSISLSDNYGRMTRDLYHCLKKYRFAYTAKTDFISMLYLVDDWISYSKQLSKKDSLKYHVYKILYKLKPLSFFGIDR